MSSVIQILGYATEIFFTSDPWRSAFLSSSVTRCC